MARSVAAQTEGLTFTGADIWVPRGPISRNEQFGIPTGYCSAVLRETTGTVSNGGGRPAPSRWARTTRTTSCALPRRLPPMHILNSTASDFQTHRTLRAGPAPRMLPWPAVTASRSSGACWLFRQHESHADAPMRRISYRGGLPPPCTALRPARGCSRAVQPLESRRGDLPTPRLSTLFSLAVNLSRYQPSPRAPRRRPYRRRGRAPSSVVRAGRAAGPTQPAASEHFPADPRQRAGQLRARHGSSGWDVGLHNPALSTVA